MGAQRGMLVLLIAIAVGVPLAAADSAACSADDPRQECLNDVDVPEGGEDCTDDHKHCKEWSESGECQTNPGFMLNSCRRSCDVCEYELE